MGNKGKFILRIYLLLSTVGVYAQSDYPWLRNGDELYRQGQYTEAEIAYRKALGEKQKPYSHYNLGNSIYQQNRMPEAVQRFQETIQSTEDPDLKAHAYYNLGNAFFQQQKFDESIRAYKESLKLQPSDEATKKNLMLAMRQLQQQQQQQQEQQDQRQQEQQQDQQQNQNQQQQDQQETQQPQEHKEDVEQSNDLSEEEAREILKAMEREDQRVQEKLKKGAGKKAPPIKDW